MPLISYSQNFEDVMLYRALKGVEQGFYIDVGAHDPEAGSVTKLFYDLGWQGINIEPIAEPFEVLKQARPRDVNLQICAGAEEGEILIHDIRPTGLATTDPDVLKMYQDPQFAQAYLDKDVSITEILSPLRTLTSVCEEYAPAQIHFLKIDVEGAEKEVLLGIDFARYRPWIVVVEATMPFSQEQTHATWEQLLLDGGYEFVYFDGLNRFYVAQEHRELGLAFQVPPNYFDNFVKAELVNQRKLTESVQEELAQTQCRLLAENDLVAHVRSELEKTVVRAVHAENMLAQEKALLEQTRREFAHSEAKRVHAEQTLHGLYNSRSWRITAPLRKAGDLVRRLRAIPHKVLARIKLGTRRRLAAVVPWLGKHPVLKSRLKRSMRFLPFLHALASKLVAISNEASAVSAMSCKSMASGNGALTPLEVKVLQDIQSAISARSL
ncbi:MAG: FkbM family methyltransferase [Gammaproteobacteria bacterium]|nr:FkbM family methyltransferase [Gammaproteobacteria bacterium]